MDVTTFDIILFGFQIVGLTVYVVFLHTLRKYRDHAPFNSPFFKIMFVVGIIDIARLLEEVVMNKFPRLAMFGMNKAVTMFPFIVGKAHIIFIYYFGHAQVIGVLLVAINHVSVCAFLKNWTRCQLRTTFIVLFGLPLLLNIPLWQNEFYFSKNGTNGGAYLFWENMDLRYYYLVACSVLCSGVAIASGLCYVVVVVKAHQVRKEVVNTKKRNGETNREEKKLIFIGVVLAAHVGFCGVVCTMWAFATDLVSMTIVLPIFILNGDMLNCVNPYLLLMCSKAVRNHFKAVLMCRPVNVVDP